MFGTFRFVLALLVVVAHVGTWIWAGVYAVFGFYVISGYLMCLVLDRRYGSGAAGLRAYLANRFLRIYPPYWVACALSAALIAVLGEPAAAALWEPWRLPASAMDWIDNIGIVTLPMGVESRLVPASWALRVEVFYYVAMGLGLGRGRRIALLWAAVSVGYHALLLAQGAGWAERYFPIPAASLPFSAGALLYHFRERIPARARSSTGLLLGAAVAWTANLVAPTAFGPALAPLRFYLNFALVAVLVGLLSERGPLSAARRALDSRLGDLTYPVYLLHMQVGLLISFAGWVGAAPGTRLFWLSLGPILACAWLMLRLVDDPVERLRDGVKRTHRAALSRDGVTAG